MRILKRQIGEGKGASGKVVLLPEEDEDLWHAYNLVSEGDSLTAGTFRKVVRESASGATSSERKAITLTIQVVATDYDVEGGSMRVKGTCISQNKFVTMGSHHSIELAAGRKFTLEKSTWDSVALERLRASTDLAGSADLAALLLTSGTATLVLIKGELSIVRAKIEVTIPKRRAGGSGHDKARQRFLDAVLAAVVQHIDFDKVKAVLLASPGFVREEVHTYIMETATRQGLTALLTHKGKFMQVHTSGGGTHALSEALAQPAVAKLLSDTKAAAQVAALNTFFELLHTDAERAMYGRRFVAYSVENGAVGTLLISDEQFRASDLALRAANIALCEATKEAGGVVHVFSTQHTSGQQLAELGGVAAILRFPLPEAEEALMTVAGTVQEDDDMSSDEEELYARLSMELSAARASAVPVATTSAHPPAATAAGGSAVEASPSG